MLDRSRWRAGFALYDALAAIVLALERGTPTPDLAAAKEAMRQWIGLHSA